MTKTARDMLDDLRSDNKQVARTAARALGSSSENTVGLLIEVLKDGSVAADLIAEALKPRGGAARAAIIPLLEDEDAAIQERAARVLGALGDIKVVDPLLAALKNGEENVRIAAAEALGAWAIAHAHKPGTAANVPQHESDAIADTRVIEALRNVLAKDKLAVQARAAMSLGTFLPDPRALDALITALKHPDAGVRSAAVQGLAQSPTQNPQAAAPVLQALRAATGDVDLNVRQLAAAALQQQQGDRNAMRRLAANQTDYALHAAEVVGQMLADKTLDDSDQEMLWHSNPYIRGNVLEKLGETAGEGAIPLILPALRDINPAVRKNAVDVLVRFGEHGIKRLLNAADDSSAYVRAGVAEALGRIGDERGLPVLVQFIQDNEVMVRRAAVHALESFQQTEANQALRRAARDADKDVREYAEKLLRDRGQEPGSNPFSRFFRKLTGGS